jgi:hypothetical protein
MRFLLTVGLFIALASSAAPRQEPFTAQFETEHYIVKTTSDKKHANQLGLHMELVYKTYSALLNYREPIKRKFVVKLYKDHDEYKRNGAGGAALAHYSPQSKELVGSYDPDGMYAIMAHEGMHQFTDMVMPEFQKGVTSGEVPTWYSEGIADCIGNCETRSDKLYMCVMSGYIAMMRTIVIQTAIRENRTPPLKEVVRYNQRDYYQKNGRLNYAIGWSFTHFLMTYPKVEDPSKQIPDGKYKKALVAFHNLLAAGRKRDEAYPIAFGINGGAPDWDRFEKEWKEYVLKFPDPLKGTALEGLSADIDRLNDTNGVYVGTIKDDAPCAKSGLKSKDVILAVDGAPALHYGKLIPPVKRVKPGATFKVKVKRGDEEIELDVTQPGAEQPKK